jgi:NAD(P)-dependent dehydrogenase (short-subunit alcohol dehydrogenase family)
MTAPNLFDLSGQVAIITGSSRGIGRAIALRMAEHGARVVISSRKAEACQAVADEITAAHGADRALVVPANISSKADLQALVERTRAHWGRVDTLVCNAASNPYYGPQAGIADEQFRKILDNNIDGQPLADQPGGTPQMTARRERQHHHRVVDRRAAWHAGDRRLRHQQGRRHAAGAQPGARVRPAQRARELHCARPDQAPTSPARCGKTPSHAVAPQCDHPAAPHRRARRDRRGCGVPGLEPPARS